MRKRLAVSRDSDNGTRHVLAFADLLRAFRVRAGLSQEDLAERAQISAAAIGALERGIRRAPYRSTVTLLVKALGLSDEDGNTLEAARLSARAPSVARNNGAAYLPAQRTSFVGRDDDIAKIVGFLGRCRLVTLTGSGGIGKTRASLEAASRLLMDRWGDICFVDLAPLTDGALIAPKIASSMYPPVSDRAETMAALASALGKRRILLIFDNCEQIVADVAAAADTLLAMCPNATILATSRERLNIAGEYVYRLQSLSVPDELPDRLEDARAYPAVDLFVQRAEAADPRITFGADSVGAIVAITRRLDGIPLAIELAAAQLPKIGLKTLHTRLDAQFILPSGRRDLPLRQQTLVATIAWSYDLLSEEERELLRSISIFSGGFTLDAAEAVCASESLDQFSIFETLSSLVEKSLVSMTPSAENVRYTLLESVRSFGLERLRQAGKECDASRRHAQWLVTFADDLDMMLPDQSLQSFVEELLPEFENVRAAIGWSLNAPSEDDRVLAGRIFNRFDVLWLTTGRRREFRQWLEMALGRIDEAQHPAVVATLLNAFISIAHYEHAALEAVDRLLPLLDRIQDPQIAILAYSRCTGTLAEHGRLTEAEYCNARAFSLMAEERLENSGLHRTLLIARSLLRLRQGRLDEARADVETVQQISEALGDRYYSVCRGCARLVQIEFAAGNTRGALEVAERMLTSEFRTDNVVLKQALESATNLRLLVGNVQGAAESVRELFSRVSADEGFVIEYAATVAALRGHVLVASRLAGFVSALEERLQMRRDPIRQATHDLLARTLREHLGRDDIAAAAAAGANLTPTMATAQALAMLDLQPVTAARPM